MDLLFAAIYLMKRSNHCGELSLRDQRTETIDINWVLMFSISTHEINIWHFKWSNGIFTLFVIKPF